MISITSGWTFSIIEYSDTVMGIITNNNKTNTVNLRSVKNYIFFLLKIMPCKK